MQSLISECICYDLAEKKNVMINTVYEEWRKIYTDNLDNLNSQQVGVGFFRLIEH